MWHHERAVSPSRSVPPSRARPLPGVVRARRLPIAATVVVAALLLATGGTAWADGYWVVTADGQVVAFGDAVDHGQLHPDRLPAPIADIAARADGAGTWLLDRDGVVFVLGAAGFVGSPAVLGLGGVVALAPTPGGGGYWVTGPDGGVFAYGDAGFFGSTGDIRLNQPVVGMAPTPSGRGYWLVATDGGVFAFGDAGFFGSTGDIPLNEPIVGISPTSSGQGYWLVASDGGVFAFGDAGFVGSAVGRVTTPVVALAPAP